MQSVVRTVSCPACGKPVEWRSQSSFRPFCSARCKGVDLGAWASEGYRIVGKTDADEEISDDTLTGN